MRIISRKLNEEFSLNESVRIRIVELNEGRVRIGVAAPDDMPVGRIPLRSEFEAGQLDCESMIIADDSAVGV